MTGRRFVALLRKEIARHSLFHVVGFAGKHFERLILAFPPETGNRAVVPARIWMARHVRSATDAHRLFLGTVGRLIIQNRGVVNRFDQARSEQRCWNSEHDILAGHRRPEIRLLEKTTGGIGSS